VILFISFQRVISPYVIVDYVQSGSAMFIEIFMFDYPDLYSVCVDLLFMLHSDLSTVAYR